MKFSSWQLFNGFKQDNRDAAMGSSFLVFSVPGIEGNGFLPIGFALCALRLPGKIFPCDAVQYDLTLGMFFEVVIPARVVLPPKIGADKRNLVPIHDSNKDGGVFIACFCSDGGDLNDIPTQEFGEGVFAASQFKDKTVQNMGAGGKKGGNGFDHQEAMQSALEEIGAFHYYFSNQMVTGPSLWISTSI